MSRTGSAEIILLIIPAVDAPAASRAAGTAAGVAGV